MSTNTPLKAPQVEPEVTILTVDTAKTIANMLMSNDPADHLMAQLILVQVDVQKSIYWLWQLAQKKAHIMVNRRTKAGRALVAACALDYIAFKSATSFGAWLIEKDWMTPEIFLKLKTDLVKAEANRSTSLFFKHTIELKDEHKKLDINDEPVIL